MNHTLSVLVAFFLTICTTAQPPAGYYDAATGSGYTLKTQLHDIINGHNQRSYGDVWDFISDYELDTYYENDGSILDIYSENPTGADPYNYTKISDQCGNYSGENSCYNREHSFPKSWFNDGNPMFTDVHHLFPTDGYVNGQRGSFPFGEVGSASYTSLNGSKRGSARSGLGYSGTVFEPIDEFKGDLARAYFYMATRYEDVLHTWSSDMLDGSSDQVFETWALDMLLEWHQNDPVSQKELDRNNNVYTFQSNRNPFVDNPTWVISIWGEEAAIADIYAGNNGQGFTVTGVVTTSEFGSETEVLFFVQDDSGGILMNYGDHACSTTQGDLVTATGTRNEENGLVELIISDLVTVSNNNTLPEYEAITESDLVLSSSQRGSRVSVEGVLIVEYEDWPVESSTSETSVLSSKGQTNFLIQLDDASFYNGTPVPCGNFSLSGILSVTDNQVVIMPFFDGEVGAHATPELSIDDSPIAFDPTEIGTSSVAAVIPLDGSHLTEDLQLAISGEFELSLTQEGVYTQELTISPDADSLVLTDLFVRFSPTSEGIKGGSLSIISCGIDSRIGVTGDAFIGPSLTSDVTQLTLDDVLVGDSVTASLSIEGAMLTENVEVGISGSFGISLEVEGVFGSSVSLEIVDGTLESTLLFVQLKPEVSGSFSGDITISSSGETISIPVSAEAVDVIDPSFDISPESISFGNVTVGSVSEALHFSVDGIGLEENLVVTTSGDFQISESEAGGFSQELELDIVDGALVATDVFVVFNPSLVGEITGTVLLSSSGVRDTVFLDGFGGDEVQAAITTSVSSISFGEVEIGNNSSIMSFSVDGSGLDEDLQLVSNDDFFISLSAASGYASSLSISPEEGNISSVDVFVLFRPAVSGTTVGSIVLTSSGVENSVTLEGFGLEFGSPEIVVDNSVIQVEDTHVGTSSNAIEINVSATGLSEELLVEASGEFEVSLGTSLTFGNQLSLSPISGDVPNTALFVRLTPSSSGTKNETIKLSSSGVAHFITLTGEAIEAGIEASESSISFGSAQLNEELGPIELTLSATNLLENLSLSVTGQFEISLSQDSDFSQAIILEPTDGEVTQTSIFVKANTTLSGSQTGTLQLASSGKEVNILLDAVVIQPDPSVTISSTSLTFDETIVGTISAVSTLLVEGEFLVDDLQISAQDEFEIGLEANGVFSKSLTLTPIDGLLDQTEIFVRLAPLVSGDKISTLTIETTGVSLAVQLGGSSSDPVLGTNHPSSITISPNPVTDAVNIHGLPEERVKFKLLSLGGETLISGMNKPETIHAKLNRGFSILKSGVYFLVLQLDGQRHQLKLIKK